MPVTNEQRARALRLAASIGAAHGSIDAAMFLFGGETDKDVVLEMAARLKDNTFPFKALLGMESRGYPPNDIALSSGMMGGDSPYGEYLDLCDAYENAYKTAASGLVKNIAEAINAGLM